MGAAYETIAGTVTAVGSTITAVTNATGDATTVKNQDLAKRAILLQAWAFNQVAGVLRIRSTKLHDNVQGMGWDINVLPAFSTRLRWFASGVCCDHLSYYRVGLDDIHRDPSCRGSGTDRLFCSGAFPRPAGGENAEKPNWADCNRNHAATT